MKVQIVNYEALGTWILSKFALKMAENLRALNIETAIAQTPDPTADVNHHINYYMYAEKKSTTDSSLDSLMITHIDNIDKLNLVRNQMKTGGVCGICMSREMQVYLAKMGVATERLFYVNPAHDGKITPRKIVVGLTCRVQSDGRKREYLLDELAAKINPAYFHFKIMGDSWEPQVANLRRRGFVVDYIDRFIYDEYLKLMPSLDYYLYMGMDEGQMGVIDALAAGIKTIITPQGYHLDAPNGITHSFTTGAELTAIFLQLQTEKENLMKAVTTWNWRDYTLKHLEIWKQLLSGGVVNSEFTDGLNSCFSASSSPSVDAAYVREQEEKLKEAGDLHRYFENKRAAEHLSKNKGAIAGTKMMAQKLYGKIAGNIRRIIYK